MNAEMRMSNFSMNPYGLSLADTFLSLCCLTEIFSIIAWLGADAIFRLKNRHLRSLCVVFS